MHTKRPILSFLLTFLLLFLISPVYAQTFTPTITRNEAILNFPNDVTFHLDIDPATPIVSAELAYDVPQFSCLESAAHVPVEVTGNSLEWQWVMIRSGNPPPGTELWWEWRLTDAQGNTYTTPRQTLALDDDRFTWRTVEAEGITIYWYEGDEVGPLLLDSAVAGLSRLENDMGIELESDVKFYIYGSAEEMREAVLYIQDWAGGVAFSEYNTILMGVEPGVAENWGVPTVRHELAHLVVGQFGRSCIGGRRPNWLEEGLAVYAEGAPQDYVLEDIERGIENNSFEPLRSLNGVFPAHDEAASIAYSQSYSTVRFLLETYGQQKMADLLLALAEGATYDKALEQVYGFNVDGLELVWRAELGLSARDIPPTPTPVLAANVPTIVPFGVPNSVPTPASAAATAVPISTSSPDSSPGSCAPGLIPLLFLGVLGFKRQTTKRKSSESHRYSHFFFLLLAFLSLSCRLGDIASTSSNPAAGYDIDRENAIFLVGDQPRTLDPAQTLAGPDGALGHVFSGLVTLDTNLQIQPDLAGGWTVSEDGLVYTFYLRKNAVFHNGRSVTAQDVIFSWERAANPATASNTVQTYLGDIEGIEAVMAGTAERISGLRAIDDHTLEVRLTAPVVYFLAKLAYPVSFVVDPENVGQADWEHHPNGTGPFVLQEWKDDEIMVLRRFEGFYRDPANIQHLVFLLGAGLPLSMYETGDIDVVGIGGSTLERARDPNNDFFSQLQTGVNMCTSVIGLNTQQPPFDDVRVRQAFNYALNKELLIDVFLNGNGLVATGPLPPGMPGFTGTNLGYPFDPEKARELLAEAGYTNLADFPPVTYYTSGYGDVGSFETAVITMWQENLGVIIEPVVLEPFTYYDELFRGNVGHIFDSGWCADYPDPQNFLDILYHSNSTQNIGGYQNVEVDALLEQARVETDVNRRIRLYSDIEEQLITDAPVVFVNYGLSAVLVKPNVQNYVLTPIVIPQWHTVSKQP